MVVSVLIVEMVIGGNGGIDERGSDSGSVGDSGSVSIDN